MATDTQNRPSQLPPTSQPGPPAIHKSDEVLAGGERKNNPEVEPSLRPDNKAPPRDDGMHDQPSTAVSSTVPTQVGEPGNNTSAGNGEHQPILEQTSPVQGHPVKAGLDKKPLHSHSEVSDHASDPPKLGDTGNRLEKAGRKRELLIAFAFIFVPMAAVAFTLIAFVYYEKDRVHFNRANNGTPELPAFPVPPSNAYYTKLLIGGFLLVSSWGSTAAGIVFAPFMLLFSFVVARELVRRYDPDTPTTKQDEYLLKEILSGSWNGVMQ